MKLRTLLLTVVALAIVSAIVALVGRRPTQAVADSKVGQSLVDQSLLEKATKLRLSDQGKTVALSRQADGTWRVSTYFDFPADFQKLSRLVDDLTEAKLQRLVTSNPERVARLEFKDTKLELLDASDQTLWSATLGKHAETGGRFVRFGTENKAYLANLNAWIDAESKSWADAQLVSVKADEIAKVEVSLPPTAGTIVVSRAKKEDPWTAEPTPASQKLKAEKITSLVSALTSLRFSDTTEPGDPKVATAKSHQRSYKLTTFDGKSYTIAIAQKPEEKKLKPPTAAPDGKSGPAALGKVADLSEDAKKAEAGAAKSEETEVVKPLAPEYETIPAGPAYAVVTASDAKAPVNEMMQKRAFQVAEYSVSSLPQTTSELFEPAPPPAPAAPASPSTPAATSAPTAPTSAPAQPAPPADAPAPAPATPKAD